MPSSKIPDRLVCPRHPMEPPSARRYLVECEDDDSVVECLMDGCGYTCQNFIKYPIAEVHNFTTGETYLKNVLTGEVLDRPLESENDHRNFM